MIRPIVVWEYPHLGIQTKLKTQDGERIKSLLGSAVAVEAEDTGWGPYLTLGRTYTTVVYGEFYKAWGMLQN